MQPQNNNYLEDKMREIEKELEDVKDAVKEIKITAKVVGAILGIASLAGIFTLIRNASQAVNETVDKAIQDQVPKMVEAQINSRFPDIEQLTEKLEKAAVESDNILQLAGEIQSSQPLRDKISSIGKQYSQCNWVTVGYDKSHDNNVGEWCPEGSFVTQLDLDADENRPSGSSPIIAQAYCCAP